MVHAGFDAACGADVEPRQLASCASRLGHLPGVSFVQTSALGAADAAGWDVVTCMEVLEHCVEDERRRVLEDLRRLVTPAGQVVISVPIEVGPSLAGKQFFRLLAGLRRMGDYEHRERYTVVEMMRSLAGARVARVAYSSAGADGEYRYYGHKGFDYRELEREIAERFTIARRLFTPMPALGALLNSQVWYVCTRIANP